MKKAVFVLALLCSAEASQAAQMFFSGEVNSFFAPDTLGLMGLANLNFTGTVQTDGAGAVTGGQLAMNAGSTYTFSGGTFGALAGNNVFSNIGLVGPGNTPAGILTITIAGPVVANTQSGFDALTGRTGTIQITTSGGYGGDVTVTPEPASTALVLAGLGAVAAGLRRRRQ